MKEYIYDESLYKRWDHAEVVSAEGGYNVILTLTDEEITYGPYNYQKAKDTLEKIVDDNVNFKYPFLKEPLKPENVDLDGAARLLAQEIKSVKEAYICKIRNLKKHGLPLPISSKQWYEWGLDGKLRGAIRHYENILLHIDPEKEPEKYEEYHRKLIELECGPAGLISDIKFIERGAAGALAGVNVSAEDILKEWKKEALYGSKHR